MNSKALLAVLFLSLTALLTLGTDEGDCETSTTIESCDDLVPRIIKLSEENEGPFSARILKLSDVEEVSRSDSELLCKGKAKLSRGGDDDIEFHWERDEDGDQFIGYSRQ